MKTATLSSYTDKPLADCTDLELFNALLSLVADATRERGYNQGRRGSTTSPQSSSSASS